MQHLQYFQIKIIHYWRLDLEMFIQASLSGLDYNQNATDVEYLTATCDFKYTLYDIVTL